MIWRLLILGARQHAQVVLDTLLTQQKCDEHEIVGFLDDDPKLLGKEIDGRPVLGTLQVIPAVVEKYRVNAAFLGISARHIKVRAALHKAMSDMGLWKVNAMHSTAYVSERAQIGKGNFMAPYAVINCFSRVGDNCAFYSGACIDHHTTVGNNVYCGPNVSMAADVTIGDNTYIGIGASIIPHVTVGRNVTIGAGTVVLKDVPDNAVLVGDSGKIIKYNDVEK